MTKEQLQALGIATESDTLTQEEIDNLLSKRVSELTAENSKNKDLISKRNSEIAEFKRKEQEKLSEDEKIKLHYEELEKENANYKRSIAQSQKVADYLSLGYSKELAEKVASAELDGTSTIELHREFLKAREEVLKAEIMKNNPIPKQGDPKPISTKDINKMGYAELLKLKNENPTRYEEYVKNHK